MNKIVNSCHIKGTTQIKGVYSKTYLSLSNITTMLHNLQRTSCGHVTERSSSGWFLDNALRVPIPDKQRVFGGREVTNPGPWALPSFMIVDSLYHGPFGGGENLGP